jgi:hypothetical protein
MKLAVVGLTLLFASYAHAAEREVNMDFSKSPCTEKARHVTKGYAVKVYPKLGGPYNQLALVDGSTGWKQEFPSLTTDRSMKLLISGMYDAWAIYGTLEDKAGKIRGFAVQFAFGDLASSNAPSCEVLPDAPERVEIDNMAPEAIRGYLVGLHKSTNGSLTDMRGRLRKLVVSR